MKNLSLLLLAALILVVACGKNNAPEPIYAPDSNEYNFFQKLAEKEPLVNPDEANELVTSNKFTIYTNDVMPMLMRQFGRSIDNPETITAEQIKQVLFFASSQEGERRMLVQAAHDAKISVTDSTVEAEMQRFYSSAGGEEKFVEAITKQGVTLDFVKEDVRKSTFARQYLEKEIYGNVEISDEELAEAYKQDRTATVRHILLNTRGKSDDEKAVIRAKMDSLLERARGGEDFAELAKQYTEDPGSKAKGGLYEKFAKGRMVKPFEDAAFNLPIESISDVVVTEYGFHIIKILSREKETRPLEEVKNELSQTTLQNKKRDAYQTALEELKKKYKYKELLEI
jgi:foldase protein PrsA